MREKKERGNAFLLLPFSLKVKNEKKDCFSFPFPSSFPSLGKRREFSFFRTSCKNFPKGKTGKQRKERKEGRDNEEGKEKSEIREIGEGVRKGKIGRPTMWVEADIRTGHVVAEHQSRESEFSDAGYKEMLDIRGQGITDRRHQLSLLEMLDPLRKTAAEGSIDEKTYGEYLKKAQAEMPASYRRFYADLSDVSPVSHSNKEKAEKRSSRRIPARTGGSENRRVIASFYIDRRSHEMLRRMAFEQGTSMSSVLCGILRKAEKER